MAPPSNAVYVVQGEMSMVVSCMRRNARWAASEQDDQDPLLQSFSALKHTLAGVSDLNQVDVDVFLGPFLAVVRSEATTGPITGVALSSINKFLSYGLIDTHSPQAASGIENIADAVTHAKFVGTDLASDEVVLMKILQVLRTILLTPVGSRMSNESVCELMQSCFRICFEMRLSELLRKSAEQTLTDMIHLLFSRLGTLSPPERNTPSASPVRKALTRTSSTTLLMSPEPDGVDGENQEGQDLAHQELDQNGGTQVNVTSATDANDVTQTDEQAATTTAPGANTPKVLRTNVRGVKFKQQKPVDGVTVAYGIPCIRELLRFLISLINPRDSHNNETMMSMGLALLTVALETGGGHLSRFPALMEHLSDKMCRNLFLLLKTDNLTLYAATLRVIFLAFEAQRDTLKFQLEYFLHRVCTMEYQSYEHKEGALDTLLQMCRIPSFLMDLYLNFDCSLYCSNLFEALLKFLSQNAYPEDRILTTDLNALDCLLTTVYEIGQRETNPKIVVEDIATGAALRTVKQQKVLLIEGVELFNKKPKKGLKYLQEKGILSDPLNEDEVARFLRSEPSLDKRQIGELISGRDFPAVKGSFVKTFDVRHLQIDQALRAFLTTFRLPGESILIERIMEEFANYWFGAYEGDKVPLDPDSTFVLLYAIIQLNVDQHNDRVKKPMTIEQFAKNQRGLNGGKDFSIEFLQVVYDNIKENEIVLPQEQAGAVKEDYDWQVMLSRSNDPKNFTTAPMTCQDTGAYDLDIFNIVWGPTITALCSMLDAASDQVLLTKLFDSIGHVAHICSRFELNDVFDNIVVQLCKRMVFVETYDEEGVADDHVTLATQLSENAKVQITFKRTFALVREHGNNLRHGWQDVLEVLAQMFQVQVLSSDMMQVFDFVRGKVALVSSTQETVQLQDTSFFSFLGGGWSGQGKEKPIISKEMLEQAKLCVAECRCGHIFTESAFLPDESLLGLCTSLIDMSKGVIVTDNAAADLTYDELIPVFFLELLGEVATANKDRIELIWDPVVEHLKELLGRTEPDQNTRLAEHALINLLRISERLFNREEMAPRILELLGLLKQLPEALMKDARPQLIAGLGSFAKANSGYMKTDAWELVMAVFVDAKTDVASVEAAVVALQFVVSDALTESNAVIVQQTALSFVDVAIESTMNIESVDSEPKVSLADRLLDLLHALHCVLPKVFDSAEHDSMLWGTHWEQLLHQMAKFCTVVRRPVRQHAMTLLQSSLMLPDLDRLAPEQWQTCLETVLFPLMDNLLAPPAKSAPVAALEEIRMRTCALLCKVFLQHVQALLPLPHFTQTWLRMLDFMEKYLQAGTELAEAVPESLKNMLLVMATAGILSPGSSHDPSTATSPSLWDLTWNRIESFLPGMCHELFPDLQTDKMMPAPVTTTEMSPVSLVPPSSLATPLKPPALNLETPQASITLQTPVPTPTNGGNSSPKLQLHSTPITI